MGKVANSIICYLFVILIITGCGGSGSSSSTTTSNSRGFTGVLQANYVKNATIKVYGISTNNQKSLIYQTTTDELGRYTIDYNSIDNFDTYKAFEFEGLGGTYVDEATKKEVVLLEPLTSLAYVEDIKDGKQVAITPVTDVVVKTLKRNNIFTKEARSEVANALSTKYLGQVVQEENLDINFFETQPVALDKPDEVINSLEKQKAYSTFLAGLSKLQEETKKSIKDISEEISNSLQIEVKDEKLKVTSTTQTALDSTLKESFIKMNDEYSKEGMSTGLEGKIPTIEELNENKQIEKYQSSKAYKPKDKVINKGVVYECKSWQEGGAWCANAVYAPGDSYIWDAAWKVIDKNSVSETIKEEDNIVAKAWQKSISYKAGDLISYNTKVYECKGWPYTGWCSREPGTNGWQEAWQELDYKYEDISNDDEKNDEEIKKEQEEQKQLPLKKPIISISQTEKTYTILVYTPFDNKNNKPKGFELYIDDKLVQTYDWYVDEGVRKAITMQKDESSHTIFVNAYKSVDGTNALEKARSISLSVSKLKEQINQEEKNLNQELLVTDSSLYLTDDLTKTSSLITVLGGSGDGKISITSDDENIASVSTFINPITQATQFIVTPISVGKTNIQIVKQASSDGKYKQSNILRFSVEINDKTQNTQNQKPAKPVIAWSLENLEYNSKFTLKWNIWWGVRAATYQIYKNSQAYSEVLLLENANTLGAQEATFTDPLLNEVTKDTKFTYFVEVCNGNLCTRSNEKSVTFKAKVTNSHENTNDETTNDESTNENEQNTNEEQENQDVSTDTLSILNPAISVPFYVSNPKANQDITAYYGNWKIYGANYQIANIPANKLTSLIYGFVKANTDGTVQSSDAYADFDKVFKDSSAHYISPDYSYKDYDNKTTTVAYVNKDTLKLVPNLKFELTNGNVKEMMLLKVKYPHLKIRPSFGGWTLSDQFFTLAKSEHSRKRFAQEAVNFVRKYGFDGIDIDWEFPVRGGANASLASIDDRRNFTLLMQEVRNAIENDLQIGKVSTIYPKTVYSVDFPNGIEHPNYINKKLDLTIAVYGGVEDKNSAGINYEEIKNIVDKVNIMSYDYHGSWEANWGKTGHQSALFNNNDQISQYLNTNSSFEKVSRNHEYTAQEVVPSNKISVGLGFYGRMAAGVQSDLNNGYNQSFTDTIQGKFEKGNTDYSDLIENYINKNTYVRYWDNIAKVPYLYSKDKKVFITYEDEASIALKAAYFYTNKKTSLFFWEISQDTKELQEVNIKGQTYKVPKAGHLLQALHKGISTVDYYLLNENNSEYSKEENLANLETSINNVYKQAKDKYEEILLLQSTFEDLVNSIKSSNFQEILEDTNLAKKSVDLKVQDTNELYSNIVLQKDKENRQDVLKNLITSKNTLFSLYTQINDIYKVLKSKKEVELLKQEAITKKQEEFEAKKLEIQERVLLVVAKLNNLNEIKTKASSFLTNEIFIKNDNEERNNIIDEQKALVNSFISQIENSISEATAIYESINSLKQTSMQLLFSDENLELLKSNLEVINSKKIKIDDYYSFNNSKFNSLKAIVISKINNENVNLPPKEDQDDENNENEQEVKPPVSNEINIVNDFEQSTQTSWVSKIILTYKKDKAPFSLKGAKFVISGKEQYKSVNFSCVNTSWIAPSLSYDFDTKENKTLTILTINYGEESWLDTEFDGNKGDICTISFSPSSIQDLKPSDIKVTKIVAGKAALTQHESEDEAMVIRKDPVSLKVKGWPSYLSMGTVTDNNFSLDRKFYESQIDSIFKYEGDGFGDRGEVIEPIVSMQTIRQARQIEELALLENKDITVMPTLVVYTANASGGGLAPEDIKTNYAYINGVNVDNNTDISKSNLVKHFRNSIRMAAQMQANKDDKHKNPATIILNPDLFGEWQKNKLNGSFQNEYCGGASDIECETYKEIKIKQAIKTAIELEKSYMIKKYSQSASNSTKTVDVNILASLYNLNEIKNSADNIEDNIKGWVQAQNFIIKTFAPDVPFAWVINLWNPGSAHWVHKKYSGQKSVWLNASKGVALFTKWIGAYDKEYRPDFLVFDKYERDGFSPAGKPSYAFVSRQWDNYLTYVKQITDFIDTPAMIWQIPGGHLSAKNEEIVNYNLLTHSATGGTYFMGDENIGTDINNIKNEVLNIPLTGTHYENASSVKELLENMSANYDWGKSKLRKAAYHNVFSILWGGGETTGAVKIATNGEGDDNWLKNKIVKYKEFPLPLYHKGEVQEDTSSVITGIEELDTQLNNLETKMNNEILLYDTGTQKVPSTIYKWKDFIKALQAMHKVGVANEKFWLIDSSATKEQNIKYAKVAIAAFLAQSMQETIQYNACDENSWQFLKDANTSKAVKNSIERGDFDVNLPMDAACGQLGQDYGSYGVDKYGVDNPYSCPKDLSMEITANTNARYYGAAGPLFTAPNSVLKELGLLVDNKAGRWEYSLHCNGTPANVDGFKEPSTQAWERKECEVYKGQKAGSYIWDGSSKRSLEGCAWWGRGVIQTTGRENFGKLNHFLGRSHVNPKLYDKKVDWADFKVTVKAPPKNPLYANMDLCSNPQLICSNTENPELKWIAGLFYWINAMQTYNDEGGKYASWNYINELKKYVNNNLHGSEFINAVSGVVNRGCPDEICERTGEVHGLNQRKENFVKVLQALGLEAK